MVDRYTVISGVIFDMDGTLTEPVLNFEEMRRRVGISPTRDILAHVNSLPKEEKARALEIIESIEEEAHKKLTLQPGTVELLNYLASKEVLEEHYILFILYDIDKKRSSYKKLKTRS